MRDIRRKEKEVQDKDEMISILTEAKYVTIAMCADNAPYLVTLTHGYDIEKNVIYFHCAPEGKKIDILTENNIVWGQALLDKGYIDGKCDQLYATAQFRGTISFVESIGEKQHALETMIRHQESSPEKVMKKQISKKSLQKVTIGRIDITYLSGKKSEKVIISP